jgi:hypothetical protein
MSPNFLKEFILYTFAMDTSYAAVLIEKNLDGDEVLISFMSAGLDGPQLKYPEVEKQAYVMFKVVKHFRPYLLKSQTKIVVPYPAMRNLFVQKELGEIRAHWMTTLQEYDLEIKLAKIGWGQGLCQMAAEAVSKEAWEDEVVVEPESIQFNAILESWYADMKQYLSIGNMPEDFDAWKRRALRLKLARYQLIFGVLFRRNFDNVLLRCLEQDGALKVLSSLHEGPIGGHFGAEVTTHKILRVGYY